MVLTRLTGHVATLSCLKNVYGIVQTRAVLEAAKVRTAELESGDNHVADSCYSKPSKHIYDYVNPDGHCP